MVGLDSLRTVGTSRSYYYSLPCVHFVSMGFARIVTDLPCLCLVAVKFDSVETSIPLTPGTDCL